MSKRPSLRDLVMNDAVQFFAGMLGGIAVVACLLLVGCGEPPGTGIAPSADEPQTRFVATFQGAFTSAETPRNHGVFVITDTRTGIEYLAVEGCGTTILVREQRGKVSVVEEE